MLEDEEEEEEDEEEEEIVNNSSMLYLPASIRPREIIYFEDKLLGRGSGGTCIFEGRLHGRVIAVKRMIHQHAGVAQQEIDFLQKVDLH